MRYVDFLRPRALSTWLIGGLLALIVVMVVPKVWDYFYGAKLSVIQDTIEVNSQRREQQLVDLQRKVDGLAASNARIEGLIVRQLDRDDWPPPRRN
jgi:hypothetical protein